MPSSQTLLTLQMHVNSGSIWHDVLSWNHIMTNYQVVTPSHFLANLLHPIYRDKKLKADHISAAQELLLDRNPDLVPDLLSFMTDNSSLPQAMLHESTNSTIHKTKVFGGYLWIGVVQSILDYVKLPANLCLCQPAQQLLNVCSQTLVSYRPNWGTI